MKLPEFIYSATITNNTSLGKNKAFPHREDVPYEYSLMKKRFASIISDVKECLGYIPSVEEAENLLNKLINKAVKIELPLRPQLEKLCKVIVEGVLSVPEETVLFDCELVGEIKPDNELRILPEYDEDGDNTYTFDDVDEMSSANDAILKRRIINSLVQGISYSLMTDSLDTDNIREWSTELLPLYKRIILLNDFLLFTKKEEISDKNPMLGAYVETHLGKGIEKTVISAQGLVYPLLLQESFRGFFELFASHGLPNDTKKAMYIIKHSDFVMSEAWDLRMGQALWGEFKKCSDNLDPSVLPYLFSSIVQLKRSKFNKTLQNIFSNTKAGKTYIKDIVDCVVRDKEYNTFKKDIEDLYVDKSLIADDGEINNTDSDVIKEEEIDNSFIHSESFINWFGDWENKSDSSFVVGEHGIPLLCYHSTEKEFDTFDPERIGSGGAGAYHGYGFNFTTQPNNTYGRFSKKVYLNARHPLSSLEKTLSVDKIASIICALDDGEIDSIACEFTGNYVKIGEAGYNREVFKAARQIYEYANSNLDIYSDLSIAATCGPKKVISIFSALGYDSSAEYYDDGRLRVVVVFDTKQIMNAPQNVNEVILYHNSSEYKTPEEFERMGVWLSDEADDAYGEKVYEYDVDLKSLNIAPEYTVIDYINKYGQREIEGARYGDDDDMIPYDEIMTQPWGSDWNRYLEEDGYDGYQFTYDGYQYWYIYNPKNVQRLTESKGFITEGKVDKQAEKRCYDVIKQGNSWLQPVMDEQCPEHDAVSGMTNFQYEYKEIRSHWVRSNIKFTPVVMNILYNQLGYRGNNPESEKIDTFSKILNLINSDKRFNSLPWNEAIKYSYEDWYRIFSQTLENEEAVENAQINNETYTNSDYKIIRVDSFEQAKQIGNKSGSKDETKLCYTQGLSTWNSYTNEGKNTAYVCLKNGWESIKPVPGEDAPMDEYGLSMIFVFVDPRGRLTTSNTRWNHGYVGDYNLRHKTHRTVDKFLTRYEISKITQVNFMDTFKGKLQRSLSENIRLLLDCKDRWDVGNYCDDYQLIVDTENIIVELGGRYNILDFDNKKFLLDNWVDYIVARRCGYALIQDMGKLSMFNTITKRYAIKDSQLYLEDYLSGVFFTVKISERSVGIYNAERQEFINDEKYSSVNPWNNFFQVFRGDDSSFIDSNGRYIINNWFDTVFEPYRGANDKYAICHEGDKYNILVYDNNSIKLLSEEWFDTITKWSVFDHASLDRSPEHGRNYTEVGIGGVAYALFEDGYVASMWQSCVCGYEEASYYEELGEDMLKWLVEEGNGDKYGHWQKMYEWYKNSNDNTTLNLVPILRDYAIDRLDKKYGEELSNEEEAQYFQEYDELYNKAFVALQKVAIYYFNYNPPEDEGIEESYTNQKTTLNEYLDKEYMKPLYDYLKNGDRYSSEGHYNMSERLVIPFFEWCTKLDGEEWKVFAKALNNCPQLKEKVRATNTNDGQHIIRCYSMKNNGLESVPTREFLKQNARRIFTITYNDSELSQYWDKFYFFVNKEEGRNQLKRGQYLDADTVLMNPEIKKPMWLVHFTGNKEDAFNIVRNGFKYGLLPNQKSKLGYTNKGIQKSDKQGKYLYAYNAEEITQGFFPADINIQKKDWRYENNFDQKVWENALHYAVMFISSGIEARHDTDNQQQVIFNADTARDFVFMTFIWDKDGSHKWGVQTKNGKIVYRNRSLTNVIKWVMNNFSQYRSKICWSHSKSINENALLNENMAVWKWVEEIKGISAKIYQNLQNYASELRKGKTFQETYDIVGVKMEVEYEEESTRDYLGISSSNKDLIRIYPNLSCSQKEIEDIITHELTHQNNRLYPQIGHYFGQHTFSWGNIQSKALDNINAILYNLWSNDEIAAYQSRSVHSSFRKLRDRYDYLKELIDGLLRKLPKEIYVYQAARDYMINNRKKTKVNRIPSLDNFKQWFIDESYKRLEVYWKRLKKNWYKYHAEVNPDEAIDKLKKEYGNKQMENTLSNKASLIIKQNIDKVVSDMTLKVVDLINNYWQKWMIKVPLDGCCASLDCWTTYNQNRGRVFLSRNKPAEFTNSKKDGPTITFTPNKYLESLMQYNMCRHRNEFKYDEKEIAKELKKLITKQLKTIKMVY